MLAGIRATPSSARIKIGLGNVAASDDFPVPASPQIVKICGPSFGTVTCSRILKASSYFVGHCPCAAGTRSKPCAVDISQQLKHGQ